MGMNYGVFQNLAQNLLDKFGAAATLRKPDGKARFDENQKKVVQKWIEIKGVAVKTKYSAKAIGESGGLIKAGDARIVCKFDFDVPTEMKDEIEFGGVVYDCLQVDTIQPNGRDTICYIVQGRRAGN